MEHSANLLWGSVSRFPQGQFIRPHCHESFFHLFYAMKGSFSMRIDNKEFTLTPGCSVLAGMNQLHEMQTVDEDVVAGELKFSVKPGSLCETLNALSGFLTLSDRAKRRMDDLFEEVCAGAMGDPKIEQVLLYATLLQIARDHTPMEIASPPKLVSACTSAAIGFIRDNFCRNILLEDIAAYSGHNANYICTMFKRETGISTNEYLNILRIHKAADMILYGDREITQIANLCGFQSPSHFSLTFKRYAGLLPTECRQLFYRSVVGIQEFPTHPRHEKAIPTQEYMDICRRITHMDALLQGGKQQ